jgi:hypothetical protein
MRLFVLCKNKWDAELEIIMSVDSYGHRSCSGPPPTHGFSGLGYQSDRPSGWHHCSIFKEHFKFVRLVPEEELPVPYPYSDS